MPGYDSRAQPPEFTPCPPAIMPETGEHDIDRRTLLYIAGVSLLAGLLPVPEIGSRTASVVTKYRWPDTEFGVYPVPGSENLPKGGPETWAFGGFGQINPVNAAKEMYEQINYDHVCASIGLTNQPIVIRNLSQVLYRRIEDRDIRVINIEGISMGSIMAMIALNGVKQLIKENPDGPIKRMPEIEHQSALSSPGDISDALDGELAGIINSMCEFFDVTPDISHKFLWSLVDGDGDIERLRDFKNFRKWWQYVGDTKHQALNDVSPEVAASMIRILIKFNIVKDHRQYEQLYTPGFTNFYYCTPSDNDPIVKQAAAEKWVYSMTELGVKVRQIDTGPGGHAKTVNAAIALGPLYAPDYHSLWTPSRDLL